MSGVKLDSSGLETPMIKIGESQLSSSDEGKLIWNDEIIEKPDLSGYVTDTELNGKNYLTSSALTDYAKKTDLSNANGVVGEIKWYSGSTVPSGYLTCNGAKVSRTTYSNLFAAIGTNWGTGDGSTTFNVPDLRECVPKGAGLTGKTVGAHISTNGLALGEFIDDRFQGHNHNPTKGAYAPGSGSSLVAAITGGNITDGLPQYVTTDGTNGIPRDGVTTEVKAVGVNFIMKAKQAPIPADLKAFLESALDAKDMLVWG